MIIPVVTTSLVSQDLIELGFALALVVTLWRRHWGYAIFSGLALAEARAGLRYPFHVWMRDAILGNPLAPTEKLALQSALLIAAAVLGLAVFAWRLPALLRASLGHRLMIGGAAIALAMLALELISKHTVDAFIYHREGPFARVAIAYFIAGAAIAGGAVLRSARSRRTITRAPRSIDSEA